MKTRSRSKKPLANVEEDKSKLNLKFDNDQTRNVKPKIDNDVKPKIGNDVKRVIKREVKIKQEYQRRNLTVARKAKVKKFLKTCSSQRKTFGDPGSEKWYQGLLAAINEPEIVLLDNLRDWVAKNGDLFNVPVEAKAKAKPEPVSRAIKRVFKQEPVIKPEPQEASDADDSSDSELFTPVKPVKRRRVKVEAPPVKKESKKPSLPRPESPLKDDVFMAEIENIDPTATTAPPNSPARDLPVTSLPLCSPECFERMLSSSTKRVHFKDEMKHTQTTDAEMSNIRTPSTPNKEIYSILKPVRSLEASFTRQDSGIGTSEEHQAPDETSLREEELKKAVEMFENRNQLDLQGPQKPPENLGDPQRLSEKLGDVPQPQEPLLTEEMIAANPDIIEVPQGELPKVERILIQHCNVLTMLQCLKNAFEIWHGFLIEPRNMMASELFDNMREMFDQMQRELLVAICKN